VKARVRPSPGPPCKPTCCATGLGAPADLDALSQKITELEQQAAGLQLQLEERDEELTAARSANRELMAQLNHVMRRG
jgi:chromosome segregation ATPase